jgi:hypothetical protein
MDKRAIFISVVVAAISLRASEILLKWHGALAGYFYFETESFIRLLYSMSSQPINSLSWFLPGVVVGFLCTKNPIKNGAYAGAISGATLGLLEMVLPSSQVQEFYSKLEQLGFAAIYTFQFSILFSVSAAFGYQINKRRITL